MLTLERRKEIEEKARKTLETSSQSGEIPINLIKITRELDLKVKLFNSVDNPGYSEISGKIDKKNKTIYINEIEPSYRQRFTLAHEIGHLLLGHKSEVDYRGSRYSVNIEELEADLFAACLLMPRDKFLSVYRKFNISELAALFGVSRVAAGIRADELLENE